jgi:hypothetical protein
MIKKQLFDRPCNRIEDVENNISSFMVSLNNTSKELLDELKILSSEREIEEIGFSIADNVICTTYFITKKDPQRDVIIDKDNIKYIEPWYYSMKRENLFGIVFHDGLSSEFIQQYETEKIKFVKCQLGSYSLNDERFILYYMFFWKHKVRSILFTDGNDVIVNQPPFDLIDNKNQFTIFVGRGRVNKLFQSEWNLDSIERFSKNIKESLPNRFYEMSIYNAGIIGGNYDTVMFFLRQMSILFININKSDNNNMAAMHYVLFNYYFPNSKKGFKKYIYGLTNLKTKIFIYRLVLKLKISDIIGYSNKIRFEGDKTGVSKYIYTGFPLNSKFCLFETESKSYFTHK